MIRTAATEAELSGSVVELNQLGESLQRMTAGQVGFFPADVTARAEPYDRVLRGLQVIVSSGRVRILVSDSRLVVEGDLDRIRALATWMAFPEGTRPGYHSHYESFPGHPDIAEESMPLVILVST